MNRMEQRNGRYVTEGKAEADRFRERVEALRVAHGLKKNDLYNVLGMSRQNYHYNFYKAKTFSERAVRGVCMMFGITPYMLLETDDELFYRLEIFRLVREYHHAKEAYEETKLGDWYADPLPQIMNRDHRIQVDETTDDLLLDAYEKALNLKEDEPNE